MESRVVYFDNPGEGNTDEVLRVVRKRAEELGITKIVVVSVTGKTAVKAAEALKSIQGLQVIAVAHPTGYDKPNTQEFTDENRALVESHGGAVLITTPVFGGLSTAIRKRFKNLALGGIVSSALALFGDGMTQAIEAVITAADCGLVRTDEMVIAIAGTGGGADTAIVCKPTNSLDFWDFRVGEILCKPRFL